MRLSEDEKTKIGLITAKKYSENEVNEILDRHHSFNDIALLRRELISRKFLSRKDDGSEYWKTNK